MTRPGPALCLALLALAGGCRGGRSDLVEAELRTKDRELRELQGRLDQASVINEALERELIDRRSPHFQAAPAGQNHPAMTAGLRDITLARGTGGVDEDRVPGDEALQLVVTPRDEDASPVKVVGVLRVEAIEITPEGTKAPLSAWEVPSIQLRRTWRAGLFSNGFHVVLPWKRLPASDKLRVVAQLALPDGRVFEADKDITIRPPVPISRPGSHPLPPPEPVPGEILPPPQPEGPSLSRLRPAELGRPMPAVDRRP